MIGRINPTLLAMEECERLLEEIRFYCKILKAIIDAHEKSEEK